MTRSHPLLDGDVTTRNRLRLDVDVTTRDHPLLDAGVANLGPRHPSLVADMTTCGRHCRPVVADVKSHGPGPRLRRRGLRTWIGTGTEYLIFLLGAIRRRIVVERMVTNVVCLPIGVSAERHRRLRLGRPRRGRGTLPSRGLGPLWGGRDGGRGRGRHSRIGGGMYEMIEREVIQGSGERGIGTGNAHGPLRGGMTEIGTGGGTRERGTGAMSGGGKTGITVSMSHASQQSVKMCACSWIKMYALL